MKPRVVHMEDRLISLIHERLREAERNLEAIRQLVVGLRAHWERRNGRPEKGDPLLAAVTGLVAERFNVSLESLEGSTLRRDVTEARKVAMWLYWKLAAKPSYSQTARCFDKHYTAAIYAVDNVCRRRRFDPNFKQKTEALLAQLQEPQGGSAA